MAVTGVDLSFADPSISAIKATGAKWVARYFSTDPNKNITKSDVTNYRAADLDIVTVWETTAGRATAGYTAGQSDAKSADGQRSGVGLPPNHVIFLAVDEDVPWARVAPYFQGATHLLGSARVGTYGSFQIVEGAHAAGIRYLWQTPAWSAGKWSSHANIRQGSQTLGGQADLDYAYTADFGQYPRPSAPSTIPVVHLSHVLAAANKDPKAAQGHTTYKAEVLILEHALNAEGLLASKWVDGSYGTCTLTAYAAFQHKMGFSGSDADGKPGIQTLTDLGHRHGFKAAA